MEKVFLVDVWLGGGEENKVVGLGFFVTESTKMFSIKWGENQEGSSIC